MGTSVIMCFNDLLECVFQRGTNSKQNKVVFLKTRRKYSSNSTGTESEGVALLLSHAATIIKHIFWKAEINFANLTDLQVSTVRKFV